MNNTMDGKRLRRKVTSFGIGFAAVASLILTGCGSGSSTPATTSPPVAGALSGVAAVGYPIINAAVNVACVAGSTLAPTTTSSVGGWQVTLTDQTLPCALQVSGGTINGAVNTTPYHAVAMMTGTVNVTPLTDLMVANLAGTATPSLWFAQLNPATLAAITQTQVNAALANLRTALGLTPLNTLNPITTVFTADPGNISDDMLAALSAAMTNGSVTYSTLLSNASASTFVAPAGLGAALTTAYSSTPSGSAAGGGGTGIGGSTISCDATQYGAGAVRAPTTTELASYARTYTGSEGTYGPNVGAPFVASGNASLVFSPAGAAAYNSASLTVSSICLGITTPGLYIMTGGMSHFDLFSSGSFNGVAPSGKIVTPDAFTGSGTAGGTSGSTAGFVVRTNPTGTKTSAPTQVVWTGSQFVAPEPSTDYYNPAATFFTWISADGISWTRNTTNNPSCAPNVSTANGLLFSMPGAYASSPFTICSSSDGITWTASTATYTGFASAIGVKFVGGKYFASLDVDTCHAISSTNGSTWTSVNLKTLALPTGYYNRANAKYCSEPFFIGGKYLIYGGAIAFFVSGTDDDDLLTQGLVYSSTDGINWVANGFALPTGVNDIPQGGRSSEVLQLGDTVVIPWVQTKTSARINPTDLYPTTVITNNQVGTSMDGLNFTYSTATGQPANLSHHPSLQLPGGMLARTSTSAVGINPIYTHTYYYTTDGITFTAAPDLRVAETGTASAYSSTLRRLVTIKQKYSGVNKSGATIATYDFP